jgi:alpha-L-rhamnosidase
MNLTDARRFYEKWIGDISDCQDVYTGHVQYTAPYYRCGGGPGGWGCAIIEVPYQYYRHYGDKKPLAALYGQMLRYFDYLEAHSEGGLVISDRAGEWCLGDWCGPIILYPEKDITSYDQQAFLPAPMVNTYFMVKTLNQLCEIAAIIGKENDIPEYREKAEQRKKAIRSAYLNTIDNNFVVNAQGANAFAVDIGVANEKTYLNLVTYYQKLGQYDTGIFATDILTRTLFEHGDGELAVDLLTNDGEQGFSHWKQNGATTFHEYWDSNRSRSHNHPMFGAVVAYLFEYLLGIRQRPNTAGYRDLVIEPQALCRFNRMSGSMQTPNGTVAVSYTKNSDGIKCKIVIPKNTEAIFRYSDQEFELTEGKNELILT